MTGTQNDIYEKRALSYLPFHLSENIRLWLEHTGDGINEIRLTAGAKVMISARRGTQSLSAVCTDDDMRYIVRSLCGNSVYSHSESIKDGYITTSDGIRAGVVGRAVCNGESVTAVSDITSAVIRIPHRFPNAANELLALLERYDYLGSVLVYSKPSGGKTTLLRELAFRLGKDFSRLRTVVVDSRCELCLGLEGLSLCVLLGYPRHKGIEIAIRTLGAQLIICDEISTDEDVAAARECLGAGVTLVASAHGTANDVFRRCAVKQLSEMGLFKAYYGIEKAQDTVVGRISLAGGVSA